MECYRCEVCAKSFTGLVCFQQHEASEKHKKKVRLSGASFEKPTPVNLDQLHCPVCMVYISGLDNYQKHVISLDHAIKVQKKNGDLLSHCVSDTFELKAERNQLMETTVSLTNSIKVVPPYAECKPCQKQFSGPEPYQQHLVSAGHKKKCRFSNEIMGSNETDFIVGNKINNNSFSDLQSSLFKSDLDNTEPPAFAKCDVCKMQFSEAMTYQMHILSESHVKNVGNQLSANSFVESQSAFKCDVCVMMFTGPVPYQQHLVSNGHKKKMNAAELSKQLATTESSPDTTLKDDYLRPGPSISNDLRKWYCDTCKKQCSGPVPYNSHILSQEHSKKLRILAVEEKLRKIKESEMIYNGIACNSFSQVTSTADLHSKVNEMEESTVECKINDLNINVKSGDTKILPDKFQVNANDLIALPNLNIIPPEKLDVTVFGPDDEIVFSNPMKCEQELLLKVNEVEKMCGDAKIKKNNCMMVE